MSLQGADDVDLDVPCAGLPCARRGPLRRRPIPEHPEDARSAPRHYSYLRPLSYKAIGERLQLRMTLKTWTLQVVLRLSVSESRAIGAGGRDPLRHVPAHLFEPAVRVARADREARVPRVEEHEVERRDGRARELLAAAARPRRSGAEEERHVGAHLEPRREEARAIADPVDPGERAQHRRRVGAAAAQPGGDRDALLDGEVDAIGDAEPPTERLRRARREVRGPVELRASRHAAAHLPLPAGGRAHDDLVGEVERHHQGRELVVAVGAARADAQDEVHLRRRARPERDLRHQTRHGASRAMGWPALHPNASRNSGRFATTPFTRQTPGECGFVTALTRFASSRSSSQAHCAYPTKKRCSGVSPSRASSRAPRVASFQASHARIVPPRSATSSPSVSREFTFTSPTTGYSPYCATTQLARSWNARASAGVHQSRR